MRSMNESDDGPDGADVDPGEPLPELVGLRETPSEGFIQRIRNSINRRVFASQTVDFSLMVFFRTFIEYLTMAIQALTGGEDREKERE